MLKLNCAIEKKTRILPTLTKPKANYEHVGHGKQEDGQDGSMEIISYSCCGTMQQLYGILYKYIKVFIFPVHSWFTCNKPVHGESGT